MKIDSSNNWDKMEGNANYFDSADVFIQDRYRLIKILISFINNFSTKKELKILDLGCGDGILTKHLLEVFPDIKITACDGSQDVINRAKLNLDKYKNVEYLIKSFETLCNENIINERYDFIISSFAIHHVKLDEKYNFFAKIFEMLNENGSFINIDTCLSDNKHLNKWYYELWKEWIIEYQHEHNVKEDFSFIPYKAPIKIENNYQSLNEQLKWLEEIGYKDVECYYKYGIFSIYGGGKLSNK